MDDETEAEKGEMRAKVYLHPLRQKILNVLSEKGHLTQTELAKVIDATPGSTRHHLMRLKEAGFVKPAGTRPGPHHSVEKLFRALEPNEVEELEVGNSGASQGSSMRRFMFDELREVERIGTRILERNPDRYCNFVTLEFAALPDALRALNERLRATVSEFVRNLPAPGAGDGTESICLHLGFYPQHSAHDEEE